MKSIISSDSFKVTKQRLEMAILVFLKWVAISVIIGVATGLIGSLFGLGLSFVTNLRTSHPWLLFLLPAAGLIIVFIYNITGSSNLLFSPTCVVVLREEKELLFRLEVL